MEVFRNLIWRVTVSCFSFLILLSSCKKDTPIITYSVSDFEILSDNYTMGGELTILYSSDGENYFSDAPTFPAGTTLWMKVNNGTEDITTDLFQFEWEVGGETYYTESIQVVVSKQVTGQVTVSDQLTLITSHRKSGQFYVLSETDGSKTPIFKALIDGSPLTSIRAFVYHPTQKLFYVSEDANAGGKLYTINPENMTALIINDNDGSDNNGTAEIWDAIANWQVYKDDSLIAIGDFKGAEVARFDIQGFRSNPTEAEICCGLGMLYNAGDDFITLSNGWADMNNQIVINKLRISDRVILETKIFNKFFEFEDDFSDKLVRIKSLAQDHNGNTYGLLFSSGQYKTYFVSIDLNEKSITHISTLGDNSLDVYNTIAFVPKYTLL